MKTRYYCDSKPDSPYFYGIFLQKHCNKFSEFQALFLILNGTAVKPINKKLFVEKVQKYLSLESQYGFLSRHYQENIRINNQAPHGMLVLDGQGCSVFANPSALQCCERHYLSLKVYTLKLCRRGFSIM